MDSTGAEYKQNNSASCDDLVNDGLFVSNYVLTDVVLKDSVLTKSGLFTIGMESHFAGEYLNSGADLLKGSLDGWKGLAATSYPAILHLVGDVVLEDWKDLEQVDSSTLIETSINSDTQRFAFLSLNIKEMLLEVRRQKSECENIIKTVGNKNYVHGGIAFYGGGKNYHILDTSAYTFFCFVEFGCVGFEVRHLDLVGEVVLHGVGEHEVSVGETLHQSGSAEAVGAVVGEVTFADSEEAGDGCLEFVVNPDAAHGVVRSGENHHGSFVGVVVRNHLVHVEEVAVAVAYHVFA